MILTEATISDIIRNNPNGERMRAAQEQYDLLYMHCTGRGTDEYVRDMKEFMREGQKETLANLIRGNRDVIARTMAPRDKIYTAKGGMEHINLPEEQEAEFRDFLSNVADGMAYNDWIRQKVQPHFDYDPNGVIFIEINQFDEPYPKIKCIYDIFEYKPNGRALEYVFFIVTEDERAAYKANGLIPTDTKPTQPVYRVIDDTTDRIVVVGTPYDRKQINITSEIQNPFGYVPAMIISDITGYAEEIYDSPLSPGVALLNELMTDQGLNSWAYWRQAFPKEWMQIFDCPTCDGHGDLDGQPCPECHGKKTMPFFRTSDVAQVDYRAEGGDKIPNPPIGTVPSDVAALQFMKDNNAGIEDLFNYTIWGVSKVKSNSTKPAGSTGENVSQTAYEAQQNEQPLHDKLRIFGKWKASVVKFIMSVCAQYKYPDTFEGCAVITGDRFMIESPDAVWDRYTKAVSANAPQFVLDTLLSQYNESAYDGNPLLFRKAELLRQVEPFVHETIEAIWIDPELPMIDRLEKKYFDEWTNTLTEIDIAEVPDQGGADILRQKLREYVTGRYVAGRMMDAQLITAGGAVLKIGDKVKVARGREVKPDHQGQQFEVSSIVGTDVTLKGGGMDGVFGYKVNDVYRFDDGAMLIGS